MVPVSMIWPLKVSRSTMAAQSLGSVKVLVQPENGSLDAPYGIVLPDACADGLFAADTTMPFVSYLN